jgi:hypothetical protein
VGSFASATLPLSLPAILCDVRNYGWNGCETVKSCHVERHGNLEERPVGYHYVVGIGMSLN